jgi:hypothetical protein
MNHVSPRHSGGLDSFARLTSLYDPEPERTVNTIGMPNRAFKLGVEASGDLV